MLRLWRECAFDFVVVCEGDRGLGEQRASAIGIGRARPSVGRSDHTRASVGLGVLRVYVRLSLYERFSAYGYIRAQ